MRSLAAALAVLLASSAASLADTVTTQSRIDAVTVFPSGAEVTRIVRVKLAAGEHKLVFENLPAEAEPGSIRVDGKATAPLEIGAVDTRRLFLSEKEAAKTEAERKRLEAEIEKAEDERKIAEARIAAADTQKALVANLANLPTRPPLPAGTNAAAGEDWAAIIALMSTSLGNIAKARGEAEAEMRGIDRKLEELRNQLATLAPEQEERTEVSVAVKAGQALDADMTVRYQVSSASWSPSYDARLATGSKTKAPLLELVRRATITQRTGEAWDNVAMQLATTRPTAGTSAPELSTMTVDYMPEPRPVAAAPAPMVRQMKPMAAPMAESADMAVNAGAPKMRVAAVAPEPVEATRVGAEVDVAGFQATYTVPGRASVVATGEPKALDLSTDRIEPALVARTVPKRDAKAFLYAKVEVPRGSPMLPGTVALFRDGTFVGNGKVPLLAGGEKHELGFGADDLVRVRHAVAEEKRGETGLISSSKTDDRNYKISVKNMHERAVEVTVLDQIPVSKNEEIKVELTGRQTPSRRDIEDKRGTLAWDMRVEPDEEKVVEFGYRVIWPAAKSVTYYGR